MYSKKTLGTAPQSDFDIAKLIFLAGAMLLIGMLLFVLVEPAISDTFAIFLGREGFPPPTIVGYSAPPGPVGP